MRKNIRNLTIIALLTLIPTFLVWLPFFLRIRAFWDIPLPQSGMATIVANYDGPLYMVVAKTFYNVEQIKSNFQFTLPVEYYAAHFPLFPSLIRLFSPILDYSYSMLAVTLASSFLALFFFYKLAKLYLDEKKALWLTLVFAFFPARWLVVRSVGSAEPLFMAGVIASVYFFQKGKYLWAGVFGAVAQLTKSPGILLFVSYAFVLLMGLISQIRQIGLKEWVNRTAVYKYYPLLFIPLSLLGVFFIFKLTYGDFWAYFHSGDNIHLLFPPFQIFNYSAPWVGTFWLEEVVFVYMIGLIGLVRLIKQKMGVIAWFTGVFLTTIFFVSHRDIVRYALPIVPFLLIAFSDLLTSKEFKIVFVVLIIPIYLFSIAFISQNVMPIANWTPFL